MSKRFTETCKWDDPWFRELPGAHKLVFLYIIDRCDNAGFWEVDLGGLAWHTKLEPKHIEGALKGLERGLKGASGWVWVKNFLRHQKNESLNGANPAHRQIISLIQSQLERFSSCPDFKKMKGAIKGLQSPTGKVQVKEEDRKGSEEGKPERDIQAEALEIYEAYPLKVGKPAALKAIAKAIATHGFDFLLDCTRSYAKIRHGEKAFMPNPSTWFHQERFNDDPLTWNREARRDTSTPPAEAKPQPKPLGPDFQQYLISRNNPKINADAHLWKTELDLPHGIRSDFKQWRDIENK